ncbi:DUF3108 domain-containing protein [Sinirhodobacter sp. WL0062]|uniref:DUF3108 domain-containing protein n=2 Tax=Rhodobacter flavimaris TaxID=2907145 RepID=A0ABS8YV84_9RHOB|nr:DUF3108 domain-containing protein [Sinirhodobacter sp. WL0062]
MMLSSLKGRLGAAAIAASATLAMAQPLWADQKDRIQFDVELKGLKAGRLTINGKIEGASYGANGSLETTGLLGALKKLRHEASVAGDFKAGAFTPLSYNQTSERGDKKVDHVIVYQSGTPVSVSRNPPRTPRDLDVDPAKQTGTIDPLTALYAVLRDVDRAEACALDVKLYDGSKRTQVKLEPAQTKGENVICSGEYRRLEGFSAKDMEEKSRFPFTLTYAPTPDGARLQVIEIATDTVYGKGRLKRR